MADADDGLVLRGQISLVDDPHAALVGGVFETDKSYEEIFVAFARVGVDKPRQPR